ncbi:hypothetical protein ACX12L_04265 [Alicycliphilus sp. T452]
MPLDDTLSSIEAQLQDMQAALLSSDPHTLEQTAAQLRQAAATLAQALGPSVQQGAAERVQAIARRLTLVRDQLARVLALTEQQAASLLPPAQGVTYGPSMAPQGAARIYRALG